MAELLWLINPRESPFVVGLAGHAHRRGSDGLATCHHQIVTSDREAHLDAVLIGGREVAHITIAEYDPKWPDRYRTLAERIRDAMGDRALSVDHIGSTSVPGLAAKPIVDILVAVTDVEREAEYVPPLQEAGLELRVREPDHRMLRTPNRDAHVHVYEPGHPAIQDYLDLRDWLCVDEADRLLYEQTKRRLAEQRWSDMNYYADAKSDVIQHVLTNARRWRGSTSVATH